MSASPPFESTNTLLPKGEKVPEDAQAHKDELNRITKYVSDLQEKVKTECDNFSEVSLGLQQNKKVSNVDDDFILSPQFRTSSSGPSTRLASRSLLPGCHRPRSPPPTDFQSPLTWLRPMLCPTRFTASTRLVSITSRFLRPQMPLPRR